MLMGLSIESVEGNYLQLGILFPEAMSVTSYIRWAEMGRWEPVTVSEKLRICLEADFLGSHGEGLKEQHGL